MKKIKFIILSACVLMLVGCGDVKLDNGKKAIVTFEEGGISAQELYDTLKETYGAENIVNLIDTFLLDKMYEKSTEENSYVNSSVKTAKEAAKSLGADFNTYLLYYYDVANENAFRNFVSLNYKRSLWIEEYGQEVVSDKQINDYYETETIGDMTLSHILITSKATDSMTDEEKENAKNEALNTAKEVIKKLNNKEDFAALAKEYSKDAETASKGGSLGKVNVGGSAPEVIEAAKNLKVGSYTTTPVLSTYGYHIIYKSAQDDKPELDDTLKASIRAVVGKEISSEQTFYLKAMKALREKNNMKFEDKELENAYEDYLLKTANSSN